MLEALLHQSPIAERIISFLCRPLDLNKLTYLLLFEKHNDKKCGGYYYTRSIIRRRKEAVMVMLRNRFTTVSFFSNVTRLYCYTCTEERSEWYSMMTLLEKKVEMRYSCMKCLRQLAYLSMHYPDAATEYHTSIQKHFSAEES